VSVNCCVFAGQGAQFPGMGKDFAQDAEIAKLFERANQALGIDLAGICFDGPAEKLTRSDICQPAVFTVSVAAYRAFAKRYPGFKFSMAAGLSLGEWTALHIAGVLDFEMALRVLRARGRFMQEACEERESGMVSIIGATPEQLQTLCDKHHLTKSNINSAAQVVISGAKADVAAAAEDAANAMKLRAVILNVAGAFHSPFMASARTRLGKVLDDIEFKAPTMPVLANVTGKPHSSDPAEIKAVMLRQVTESVRWCDDIESGVKAGAQTFIEFGPGHVLSGLIRRIDKTVKTASVQDIPTLDQAAQVINN
jgi:[acyl-carrier-protein] S-malonyltransferase